MSYYKVDMECLYTDQSCKKYMWYLSKYAYMKYLGY